MKKIAMLAAAAAVMVLAGGARAAEVEVKLLNKGADGVMVFEPAFVKIAPGDSVKFEQEGVYGIKCLPHYGMGMVAMIVVGNPGNVDQAKAVPQVGKAKQVFATLFGKLEASKTASR